MVLPLLLVALESAWSCANFDIIQIINVIVTIKWKKQKITGEAHCYYRVEKIKEGAAGTGKGHTTQNYAFGSDMSQYVAEVAKYQPFCALGSKIPNKYMLG